MLYLIGIGLGNERDITLNALDIIKNCKFVYLENYTSFLGFNVKDLENLTGKKVILADRTLVESGEEILNNAKSENVALLIKGDVFSATTHTDLFLRSKENKIECKILHNSSVLTAIGDTGLSLYKFGKVASIPFENSNITSPYETLEGNKEMHTLFLLDLKPSENKYMNFKDAINYLIKKLKQDTYFVVCAGLGTEKQVIKYGKASDLLKLNIDVYPQCVIAPGKLHFMEEDMLNSYKI